MKSANPFVQRTQDSRSVDFIRQRSRAADKHRWLISMKTIIACILTCLSVTAASTNDVQVFTAIDTNTQPGTLITLDTFTRAGQTNLVRDVRTKDGVFTMRSHTFYHGGMKVGGYVSHPTRSFSYSVAGAPYSMSFQYDASKHITSAFIASHSTILEAFGCTNGVFYPENSTVLHKAATIATSLAH
jgi:hypothetical protein